MMVNRPSKHAKKEEVKEKEEGKGTDNLLYMLED
jgi:hypothetical protein